MTQVCLTAFFIAVCYDITKIIIKQMELSFMNKKNLKEGKYIN